MTAPVDTTSEAWRHDCEVRHVAAMPTRQQRADYINGIERKRGKPAADRIRADLPAVWQAMRAGTATPAPQEESPAAAPPSAVHLGVNAARTTSVPVDGSFLTTPPAGSSGPDRGVESGAAA